MDYIHVSDPCRNFCILASVALIDPKDNHEKIVYSSFVEGGTGILVFVDRITGIGEKISLPGDEGAWALLNLNDEKLLVGTCGQHGYLHSLDLKTRTWAEPLYDENEKYIWNLVKASDGKVYGGTWPGGVLLQYDPELHILKNIGRLSDIPENMYLRYVYGDVPGYVFASCIAAEPHLAAWNIKTGVIKRFGKPEAEIEGFTDDYIITSLDDKKYYYDIKTFELIDDSKVIKQEHKVQENDVLKYVPSGSNNLVTLSDGSIAGIRGQDYFIIEKDDPELNLKQIPAEAPPTQILTIINDGKEGIWGSSGFGQTIFSYNPEQNTYWNSPGVCSNGGEVYGMCFVNSRLFLSSYSGGDHVVYDPLEDWNQFENINPKTLESVRPQLIRPTGRSVIGPDGAFWTGWSAKYGIYGGGLSRVDVNSLEVSSWYDPIPDQEIAWLAADDRYIYFTTDGNASGLARKEDTFHFVVFDPYEKKIKKDILLPGALNPGVVAAADGYVLVSADKEIKVFGRQQMNFLYSVAIMEHCNVLTVLSENEVLAFCDTKLYLIDLVHGSIKDCCSLPGKVISAAKTEKGDIYFVQGQHLYKLIYSN